MSKKLKIKDARSWSVEIHRQAISAEKLVYIIVMAKPIKYPNGRSKIAYIGTTKNGISRIASSGAHRARELLKERGQKSLKLFTMTCSKRTGLKNSAKQLESELLSMFRLEFGKVPIQNKQGKNVHKSPTLKWFSAERLQDVIEKYSSI